MVKVTVDTNKDSQEEILKAVEFLRTLAGTTSYSNEEKQEVSDAVPMDMFDTPSSKKEDEPKEPSLPDIKVLEY